MAQDSNEEVITLVFENAANESKRWQIAAVSGELIRDYVGRAAKQLFTPVPTRVGIATKDGAIIQNWADNTVGQIMERYNTNHIVLGTPDQLGDPSLFSEPLKGAIANIAKLRAKGTNIVTYS